MSRGTDERAKAGGAGQASAEGAAEEAGDEAKAKAPQTAAAAAEEEEWDDAPTMRLQAIPEELMRKP